MRPAAAGRPPPAVAEAASASGGSPGTGGGAGRTGGSAEVARRRRRDGGRGWGDRRRAAAERRRTARQAPAERGRGWGALVDGGKPWRRGHRHRRGTAARNGGRGGRRGIAAAHRDVAHHASRRFHHGKHLLPAAPLERADFERAYEFQLHRDEPQQPELRDWSSQPDDGGSWRIRRDLPRSPTVPRSRATERWQSFSAGRRRNRTSCSCSTAPTTCGAAIRCRAS